VRSFDRFGYFGIDVVDMRITNSGGSLAAPAATAILTAPPGYEARKKKKKMLDEDSNRTIMGAPEMMGNPFMALEAVAGEFNKRTQALAGAKSSPSSPPPVRRRMVSTSAHAKKHERFEEKPLFMAVAGYISYAFLFIVG